MPRKKRLLQMQLLARLIMADVEIYTNKGCPSCVSAKQYLDRKKVKYQEIKLGRSRKTDLEFSLKTNNSKTVPQIFISGKLIGGYDDLIDYDRAGELDWRLGLAPRPKVGIFQTIIRYLRGQRY
tara:strand:+ start:2029 stop:2400 length:372 start_codon:yes stop_codon:yes gene_type:complete